MAVTRARWLILQLFFVTGATGLIYEVVWTRQLSLIFGVTVFAASSVLAAYMGGLALGSYLFGPIADRVRNPVRLYALLEAGIGLSALLVPLGIQALEPVYVAAANALEGNYLLFNLIRALLAGIVLLIPTTLMGGTLPAIGRFLVDGQKRVGFNVGLLYAVNTFGAVAGCLAAGFVFVPTYGLSTTTVATAGVNLAVAALLLVGRVGEPSNATLEPRADPTSPRENLTPSGRLAMLVFALSGFAALGSELIWTRVLVLYLHNTTYAFSVMLAVFLLGLAAGNALMMRFYDRIKRPLLGLGIVQIGVGLSILLAAQAYQQLPNLRTETVGLGALDSFANSLALMSLRAGSVLLPSTLLLGMTFPLVARIVCGETREFGRRLGGAYAANTFGAVLGSLVTAFVLVPALGLRGTLIALSALASALGVACILATVSRRGPRLAMAATGLLLTLLPAAVLSPTLFVDAFARGSWELTYYQEGATDTIGVWEYQDGARVLAYGDQRGTAGTVTNSMNRRSGHIAHLLHPNPQSSLQIAFGVGNTLAAAELHPEIERLDCVEISPQVRAAASYFWTNEGVLDKEPVELIIDDGRNYLLRTDKKYDVITLDPPEFFTANVVNLYTREFYQLAYAALEEDGILTQWLPAYATDEDGNRMLARALAEVFPETSLWWLGHWQELDEPATSLILVGAKRPITIDPEALSARMLHPAIASDLARIDLADPASLLSLYLAGPQGVRRWAETVPPVTDDRTVVDFVAPRSVAAGFGFGTLRQNESLGLPEQEYRAHLDAMFAWFRKLREPIAPLLAEQSDAETLAHEVALRRALYDRQLEQWRDRMGLAPSSSMTDPP